MDQRTIKARAQEIGEGVIQTGLNRAEESYRYFEKECFITNADRIKHMLDIHSEFATEKEGGLPRLVC